MHCAVVEDNISLGEDPVHAAGQFDPLPLLVNLPWHMERFPSKRQAVTPVWIGLNSDIQLCNKDGMHRS